MSNWLYPTLFVFALVVASGVAKLLWLVVLAITETVTRMPILTASLVGLGILIYLMGRDMVNAPAIEDYEWSEHETRSAK